MGEILAVSNYCSCTKTVLTFAVFHSKKEERHPTKVIVKHACRKMPLQVPDLIILLCYSRLNISDVHNIFIILFQEYIKIAQIVRYTS